MAAVQFIAYANLVVNYRAIAAGMILPAMFTDALAAAIGYFIVRKVAKSEGYDVLVGMVIGGSLAAWVGIWMTEAWQ